MDRVRNRYVPPIVSTYGQDGHSEDLTDLVVKRKLTKKNASNLTMGTDKLYGYEGSFAVFSTAAVNVAAVVNAVAYTNAVAATMVAAVTAAIYVPGVVTFPGNMQNRPFTQ